MQTVISEISQAFCDLPTSSYRENIDDELDRAVIASLERLMGAGTLTTVNFHLRLACGTDFSQLASNPSGVEKGLRVLFGRGSEEILRAAIFAAFRVFRLVPEREYPTLQNAFAELYRKISVEKEIP